MSQFRTNQSGEKESVKTLFAAPSKELSWRQIVRWNRRLRKAWMFVGSVLILSVGGNAPGQSHKMAYPRMAPLSQYLMPDRDAEIAMARSAAPEAISKDATILVLGPHGYMTAVEGKNGFVCVVERSWMSAFNATQF